MFKTLWEKYKAKKEAKAKALAKALALVESEKVKMYTELYTQSIVNVRYIQASISTMSGMANGIKGNNIGETKSRRAAVRAQIKWYERKLPEEIGMVEYFAKLAGIQDEVVKFNV